MTIIALKVFLTIWSIAWFCLLGKVIKDQKNNPDEWFSLFLAWFAVLIATHFVLVVPVGLFCWIWFGF